MSRFVNGYSRGSVCGGRVAALHPSAHAPADCRCTASTGACGNASSALHSLHRPTTQHVEIGRRAPLCQPVIPHILSVITQLSTHCCRFRRFFKFLVTRNPHVSSRDRVSQFLLFRGYVRSVAPALTEIVGIVVAILNLH